MNLFDRYAPAIAVFFLGSVGMPVWFSLVVLQGGSPIGPDVYGEAVHSIPALVWTSIQIAIGLLAVLGFALRIRPVAFVGSAGMAGLIWMFGIMAMEAAQGAILQAMAMLWGGPCCSLAALLCCVPDDGRETRGEDSAP